MFATWGRTPAATCPHCKSTLFSVTGLSPLKPARPELGDLSICDQCLTWLVFLEGDRYRAATASEIEDRDPAMRKLAMDVAIEIGKPKRPS